MKDTIDVSVIYVNYNSTDLLITSIESVIEHTSNLKYEIIVVDNASPDGGIEKIGIKYKGNISILKSEKNLGFGGANNLGANIAKGEYLFFLNPDTKLLNNAVFLFWTYCINNKNKKIGTLGSILLDSHLNPNHSYSVFLTPYNVIKGALPFNRREKTSFIKSPIFVDYITGADLFMPRNCFVKMNGFDTRFFMYSEEVDLQYRISKDGYCRVIIPEPRIIHYDGGSYSEEIKPSPRRRYEKDKSRIIYIKKHYSSFSFFLFRLFFLIVKLPALVNKRYNFTDNLNYLKMIATL